VGMEVGLPCQWDNMNEADNRQAQFHFLNRTFSQDTDHRKNYRFVNNFQEDNDEDEMTVEDSKSPLDI
jgi:hypothetical protein